MERRETMERNSMKGIMMATIFSVILVDLVLLHAEEDHPSSSLAPSLSSSLPCFPLPTPAISLISPYDVAGKHRKGLPPIEKHYPKKVVFTKARGCIRKCMNTGWKYKFVPFKEYLLEKCMKDCLRKNGIEEKMLLPTVPH